MSSTSRKLFVTLMDKGQRINIEPGFGYFVAFCLLFPCIRVFCLLVCWFVGFFYFFIPPTVNSILIGNTVLLVCLSIVCFSVSRPTVHNNLGITDMKSCLVVGGGGGGVGAVVAAAVLGDVSLCNPLWLTGLKAPTN